MQKWLALGAVSGEDSHLKIVVTVVVVYDLIPTGFHVGILFVLYIAT